MREKDKKGLTTTREEDIAEWYEQVCLKAKIAEFGAAKGTMIIRPKGYYIWEQIQAYINKEILEKRSVQNAYFPIFIPESFFTKEASHAEGFSPEVAWIDESLTKGGERLAIRPTSETIMYDSFGKWIRSYKDLPLKINQWNSVVRWETQATKLFLRSREFLWHEGHCVYETQKECQGETIGIVEEYQEMAKDILALPTIIGLKTKSETFAGATQTYTIESFMPDGKALQSGTTHNLTQGFAKAFNITYTDNNEQEQLPFQNSWAVSTRLLGATIMTHSDNKGLILPPKIAQHKVVIIPLLFKGKEEQAIQQAQAIAKEIKALNPIIDDSQTKPGIKFSEWELQGIPLRIEIGPKDIETNQVVAVQRNNNTKHTVKLKDLKTKIPKLLDQIQTELYEQANKEMQKKIQKISTMQEFKKTIKSKKVAQISFCNQTNCEEAIKEETQAGSRCILLNTKPSQPKCIKCNTTAEVEILFSKSY